MVVYAINLISSSRILVYRLRFRGYEPSRNARGKMELSAGQSREKLLTLDQKDIRRLDLPRLTACFLPSSEFGGILHDEIYRGVLDLEGCGEKPPLLFATYEPTRSSSAQS